MYIFKYLILGKHLSQILNLRESTLIENDHVVNSECQTNQGRITDKD